MSNPYSRTAVLLFSLPAPLDASRKKVVRERDPDSKNSTERSRAVWAAMQRLTAIKVRASGIPCILSTEIVSSPDYSASFGEQLHTAVEAVLSHGYERVVVIGNDCPDLRVGDLRRAANALAQGQLPIGYDQRGGVFLLGLDRRFLTTYSTQSFVALPWQTAQLGAALTDFLSHTFGAVACLPTRRSDWNDHTDLRAGSWLLGAFAGLARQLWALIGGSFVGFHSASFSLFTAASHIYGLRAPPTACR